MFRGRAKGWERKGVELDNGEMRMEKWGQVDIRSQLHVNKLMVSTVVWPCPAISDAEKKEKEELFHSFKALFSLRQGGLKSCNVLHSCGFISQLLQIRVE